MRDFTGYFQVGNACGKHHIHPSVKIELCTMLVYNVTTTIKKHPERVHTEIVIQVELFLHG